MPLSRRKPSIQLKLIILSLTPTFNINHDLQEAKVIEIFNPASILKFFQENSLEIFSNCSFHIIFTRCELCLMAVPVA